MGIDISITTDIDKQLYSPEYYDLEENYFSQHSLSRTFCSFMFRKTELNQIREITKVDILPLCDMEESLSSSELESSLYFTNSEEEKDRIRNGVEMSRIKLNGNIYKVLNTIISLINELNKIQNLAGRIKETDLDSLTHSYYFSEFKKDIGEGYIDNNLGRDLRNFKRFLEYAEDKGARTIWFDYG